MDFDGFLSTLKFLTTTTNPVAQWRSHQTLEWSSGGDEKSSSKLWENYVIVCDILCFFEYIDQLKYVYIGLV